jgi:hypothetical protein
MRTVPTATSATSGSPTRADPKKPGIDSEAKEAEEDEEEDEEEDADPASSDDDDDEEKDDDEDEAEPAAGGDDGALMGSPRQPAHFARALYRYPNPRTVSI